MDHKEIKMIAPDADGNLAQVFPWSGAEVAEMQSRFYDPTLDCWVAVPGKTAIAVYSEWIAQWQPAEIKARRLVSSRSTDQLIADLEATDKMSMEPALPFVRSWLMDELEIRDPDAFEAWLQSSENSPRRFYLILEEDLHEDN